MKINLDKEDIKIIVRIARKEAWKLITMSEEERRKQIQLDDDLFFRGEKNNGD